MPELSPSTIAESDPGPEVFVHETAPPQVAAVMAGDRRPKKQGRLILIVAGGWLVLLTFLAVFADFLPLIKDPNAVDAVNGKQPPSLDHFFGTDKIGRDIFSRTIYGARLSLAIAGVSVVVGLLLGGLLGLTSGYFKGRLDRGVSYGVDIMLAFPSLIFALAITSFLGRGPFYVILALSVLSIPPLTRIVRASTMVFAEREFVLAAKSLGAKNGRVLVKEILPNVVPAMLSFALTGLAVLIVAEGALSFLGQSVPPPNPTWGILINEGRQDLRDLWWISLMPAFAMFLTILSLNMIGDVISKRFDIKESLA